MYIQSYSLLGRRLTPKCLNEVFILGKKTASSSVELLGTVFAVTKKHLLTAAHNLIDAESQRPLSGPFQVDTKGKKVQDFVRFYNPIDVHIVIMDKAADWAILEVIDPARYFTKWLPICKQLPNTSEKLTAYFAPIGQFLTNAFEDITIWPDVFQRILQYDRNDSVILVSSGLYRGSCGCPYVSESGEVVALHLESIHEGKNISAVKSVSAAKKKRNIQLAELKAEVDEVRSVTTDLSDVHASIRQGLVLVNIVRLVTFVDTENAL